MKIVFCLNGQTGLLDLVLFNEEGVAVNTIPVGPASIENISNLIWTLHHVKNELYPINTTKH